MAGQSVDSDWTSYDMMIAAQKSRFFVYLARFSFFSWKFIIFTKNAVCLRVDVSNHDHDSTRTERDREPFPGGVRESAFPCCKTYI